MEERRAKVLQRVRTFNTAFFCMPSRTEFICGFPGLSLVTAIPPLSPCTIIRWEAVFVCVCTPHSEAASKDSTLGLLDSFSSIHLY